MTPLRMYKIVHSMSLHFKNEGYSVLKYGLAPVRLDKAYYALSEPSKRRYISLSQTFISDQDAVYACIANALKKNDIRYSILSTVRDNFYEFKGRRESITYRLNNEISDYFSNNENGEQIFFKYLSNKVSPEFMILVDLYEGDTFSKIEESYVAFREDVRVLRKYKDFFNHQKYLKEFQSYKHHEPQI